MIERLTTYRSSLPANFSARLSFILFNEFVKVFHEFGGFAVGRFHNHVWMCLIKIRTLNDKFLFIVNILGCPEAEVVHFGLCTREKNKQSQKNER